MADDEQHRRASDRELARVLRFIDGGDRRDGAETRLDRVERNVVDFGVDLMDLRAAVKVLTTQLNGNPLLDSAVARSVVSHIEIAHSHSLAARAVGLFLGRSIADTALRVVEVIVLAYIATHVH